MLLSVLLIVMFALPTWANTDLYNQGTIINLRETETLTAHGIATAYYETSEQVEIVFKVTWADSSDQYHSRPFYIGDVNVSDAYCRAIVSAASDVNIFYHFSYDNCNTWVTITPANFDTLSNTSVADTIGIEVGVNDQIGFHSSVWMIVEFADGGTALNDDEVCTWKATFSKDGVSMAGYSEPYVQRVKRTSNTNP